MYKIGEFSRITGLTVKALRYYDEIDLLRPEQVDEENGYRYYSEANFDRALWIRSMKRFDFTIREMKDVIVNISSDDDLADYLKEKQEKIEMKIAEMKAKQRQIDQEIEMLKEVRTMNEANRIEVIEVPEMMVASIRYKGRYEECGKYLGELYKVIGMKGVSEPFSMYYDDSYMEENADVEVCVEVKKPVNKGQVKTRTLTGGRYVSLVHVGPYDTLSQSYKAIADYMNAEGYETEAPSREIYLKGPGMLFKGNPKKYETKIMFKIK